MQIEDNPEVQAAVAALHMAASVLALASLDPARRAHVDACFDTINEVMTTLQLILTSSHHRKKKPVLRVVK